MPYEYRAQREGEVRLIHADNGSSKLTWYPAVFNSLSEDLGGFRERISHGAFRKTLTESDVKALFNHDPNLLLGRTSNSTVALLEDRRGLLAEVTLPDTQYARDLMTIVERGDISGGSFAFTAVKERWLTDEETGGIIRDLRELRLYDVSIVTYPAYPGTEGIGIRSALSALDIELDDVVAPLLRVRAGAPLEADERRRLRDMAARLNGLSQEPPSEHSPVPLSLRKRQLELIRLAL